VKKTLLENRQNHCSASHMLDLSEEPLDENLATCAKYLERMSKMGMTLEIELV
jgi:fructose-bisphosphate aldolase class II